MRTVQTGGSMNKQIKIRSLMYCDKKTVCGNQETKYVSKGTDNVDNQVFCDSP